MLIKKVIIETVELKSSPKIGNYENLKCNFNREKKATFKKQSKKKKIIEKQVKISLQNIETVDFACIQRRFGAIGVLGKL